MIHVQDGGARQLDRDRFNEAFMMHISTSPQYSIIASLDVASAMMEGPAGRSLLQEMFDEALSFRRALANLRQQLQHFRLALAERNFQRRLARRIALSKLSEQLASHGRIDE